MEDLNLVCQSIIDRCEAAGVTGKIPKATSPSFSGWSDEHLAKLEESVFFPKEIQSRGFRQGIISKFFSFYFSGLTYGNETVVATILDAVAISMYGDKFIFTESDLGDPAFYYCNDGKAIPLQKTVMSTMVRFDTTGIDPEELKKYQSCVKKVTATEVQTFISYVERYLTNFKQEEETNDDLIMCRLTGFLALTLCRAATKNEVQLGNAFLKTTYVRNLNALVQLPDFVVFAPPSAGAISSAVKKMSKGSEECRKLFMKLAHKYVVNVSSEVQTQGPVAMLSAAVLIHTARNGLGMIQLMDEVSTVLNLSCEQLMRKTHYLISAASWTAIVKAQKEMKVDNKTQYSYNWCRIINDGYMRGLAPRDNIFLATIFLAVLERVQGPGVWSAEWAKDTKKTNQAAIQLGYTLFEECQPHLKELKETKVAEK